MERGKGEQRMRPLADVLRELCALRGLTIRQVVTRASRWCDQGTSYRVFAGSTTDPRTSTLAALCRALDVRPQDVFERAGLWNAAPGAPGSTQQAQLRTVWTSVAMLPDAERTRITQVVRAMVETAHAQRAGTAAPSPTLGPSRSRR